MTNPQNSTNGTTVPVFEVESGVTSVFLDTNTLSTAAGLDLASTDNTITPASDDFQVGFNINDETDFTFTRENGFTPKGGTIEHDGTVTFNSDLGPVTVGEFSIGFDASRVSDNTSGLFVTDTAGTGAILFDVSNPGAVDVAENAISIRDADLLVSKEFAGFLQTQGLASSDLTGADVGDVQTDANIIAGDLSNLSSCGCNSAM
jgi:hypothetical protein